MNEVERRLNVAVMMNLDPEKISPSGVKFAWRRVWGWDYALKKHRWLWLEWVEWFRPLGLLTEYFTYTRRKPNE